MALVFAVNVLSTVSLNRTFIDADLIGQSTNWECGIAAADVIGSDFSVTETFIDSSITNTATYQGVIVRLIRQGDMDPTVLLSLSVSSVFSKDVAGIIAEQQSGFSTLELQVNLVLQNNK